MTHTIFLKGMPVHVAGTFPQVGVTVPDFLLVTQDLSNASLHTYQGKRKILNIFPSVDTGVCATSVRTFNQAAANLDNTVVLCISADLPFAQARFCGAEGLNKVITLSTLRSPSFKTDYGVAISDGPLEGLAARAVVVLNEKNEVIYSELVSEITHEPDYEAALASLI